MTPKFPYNLPIWRSAHKARSPDDKRKAEIRSTSEISMGNPTYGTLRLSDDLELARCNPSFIWSDDSRYLAVPQFHGFWNRQRLILVDCENQTVFASKKTTYYYQPDSFSSGQLIVTKNPFKRPSKATWNIPADLNQFKKLSIEWPILERSNDSQLKSKSVE